MTIDPQEFGITDDPSEPATDSATHRDMRYMLRLLAEYRDLKAAQESADAWMKAIEGEHIEQANQRHERISEILTEVEVMAPAFRVGDSEHVDIPGHARIQFRTTKPTLRVADKQEAETWCYANERTDLLAERVEIALKTADYKTEAEGEMRRSGQLLPGIEQVPERTTMSIKMTEVSK